MDIWRSTWTSPPAFSRQSFYVLRHVIMSQNPAIFHSLFRFFRAKSNQDLERHVKPMAPREVPIWRCRRPNRGPMIDILLPSGGFIFYMVSHSLYESQKELHILFPSKAPLSFSVRLACRTRCEEQYAWGPYLCRSRSHKYEKREDVNGEHERI